MMKLVTLNSARKLASQSGFLHLKKISRVAVVTARLEYTLDREPQAGQAET